MKREAAGGKVYSTNEDAKVALREWAAARVGKGLVIDAFAGEGHMSRRAYVGTFDRVVCIEKGEKEFAILSELKVEAHHGNNLKLLPSILADNPSPDLVDLDAFGDPWEQVEIVLRNVKTDKPLALVVTDGCLLACKRNRPIHDPMTGERYAVKLVPTRYRGFAEGRIRAFAESLSLNVSEFKTHGARTGKSMVLYWAAIITPVPAKKNGSARNVFTLDERRRAMHLWASEGRTLKELSKEFGVAQSTVTRWKQRNEPEDWETYRAGLNRRITEVTQEWVAEMTVLQLTELRRIQESCMRAVDSDELGWNSKDGAARVYTDTVRAIQLLLEKPTDRHAVGGDSKTPLHVHHSGERNLDLGDEELDKLAAAIQRESEARKNDDPS